MSEADCLAPFLPIPFYSILCSALLAAGGPRTKCNVPEPSSTCMLLLKTPSAVRHSSKNERVTRG